MLVGPYFGNCEKWKENMTLITYSSENSVLETSAIAPSNRAFEIEETWGMKTTTVPVIIGAFGLVKKGTENYIGKIPGNIRITELQKTVLLGTAHILSRTLSIK